MRLSIALDEKMMDVRLRDRLMAEGKITQKQVQDYISALPDDESNVDYQNNDEKRQE